jgi:hypothetical protein
VHATQHTVLLLTNEYWKILTGRTDS